MAAKPACAVLGATGAGASFGSSGTERAAPFAPATRSVGPCKQKKGTLHLIRRLREFWRAGRPVYEAAFSSLGAPGLWLSDLAQHVPRYRVEGRDLRDLRPLFSSHSAVADAPPEVPLKRVVSVWNVPAHLATEPCRGVAPLCAREALPRCGILWWPPMAETQADEAKAEEIPSSAWENPYGQSPAIDGIAPAWEARIVTLGPFRWVVRCYQDAGCKNGGRWVIKLEKVKARVQASVILGLDGPVQAQSLDNLWLALNLALIGEDEKRVMAIGREYRNARAQGCSRKLASLENAQGSCEWFATAVNMPP
eukprot:Skav230361  [mRNA]  locus=scaffold291:48701:55912:- [translate_table: standard]